jgi:hypothetical protein
VFLPYSNPKRHGGTYGINLYFNRRINPINIWCRVRKAL